MLTAHLRVTAVVLAGIVVVLGAMTTSTATAVDAPGNTDIATSDALLSGTSATSSETVAVTLAIEELVTQRAQMRTAILTARNSRFARALRHEKYLRNKVIRIARAQIGDPYVRGAGGPTAFDCSGLTSYVIKQATGRSLPHQSRAQYSAVKKISRKSAKPGDLVFFFRNGARHVGIYIGGGRMIDATNPGTDVRVSPVYGSWGASRVSGFGRVIPSVAA